MSQTTEPTGPTGPTGPLGGPVGPMGGPVGPMGGPVGPMGGPVGPMGGPVGPMGGPMGPMGDPMAAPMGEAPTPAAPAGRPEPIALKSMARVDLLPLEIVENRAFARVRRGVVALVMVSVLIAAAAVYWAHTGISSSQQRLDAAQSEQQNATNAQTQYATLPQLEAQLAAAKTSRLTAMGQDVLFYRLLNDLKNSLPAGVTVTTVNTTLSSAGAAAATTAGAAASGTDAASALTPSGIGTIQLSGTSTSYSVLASWLNTAADVNGVDGVTLTSASEASDSTGSVVSFNATAVLTSAALSNRYTKEG